MDAYLGIDLGSTTSKAVLVDDEGRVIGRGITNTRSNYDVAADVVRAEALIDARFGRLQRRLAGTLPPEALEALRRGVGVAAALGRLDRLAERCRALLADSAPQQQASVGAIFDGMRRDADEIFGPLALDRSRFFRDAAGSRFFASADEAARGLTLDFEETAAAYDRGIVETENSEKPPDFDALLEHALSGARFDAVARAAVARAVTADAEPLEVVSMVGTGYGRQRLPFPKEQIQSEILCHGLGAHALFPNTRTVLDIGGQDTKAIQVDSDGLVTSFQMNDRCAAGCGRYLGYIADEMNVGVHELGPLALRGTRAVKISSTCTVFAGVELRELLSTGERRENILLGLHRAIVLRAMSLLARSGGVADEFTFTGGVAKNDAVVACLRQLVGSHYGERRLNIHPDSIYTGALGAALFATRGRRLEVAA